jgi:hypothetical protein
MIDRLLRLALAASCALFLASCTVTLVQPYDERLLNDTEEVFKKASALIDAGIASSPTTDGERATISDASEHPGHVSKFSDRYASLSTDADALIVRALAGSRAVDPIGDELQTGIEELIEQALPSACDELQEELAIRTPSLTVKNYLDLKCIFVRWKAQHADPDFTQHTQVLKKVNWELRRSAVFSAVLAIQSAEMSKAH